MKYKLRDGVCCVYDANFVVFCDTLSGHKMRVNLSVERGAFEGILETEGLLDKRSTIIKVLILKRYLINCEMDAYVKGIIDEIMDGEIDENII